jgi:hemerythrin superfamily protein
MRATDLLKHDHAEVKALFHNFEQTPATNGNRRQELMDTIAEELEVHAQIEEEIFYPAVRLVSNLVDHAQDEHNRVRSLIGDAEGRDPKSQEFAAKVAELKSAVLEHVSEEEGQMFAQAERLGADELDRLGREMAERKHTLKTSLIQRGIRGMKLAAKKIA